MTRPPLVRTDPLAEPSSLLIPQPHRVVGRIEEIPPDASGAEVVTLQVVPVEDELFEFRPAQVSMLGAFGVGEAAISLSSATTNRDHHAYTIRRAGPISGALIDTPVGGQITVRGPFGRPWPIDTLDSGQLVIVGGGLGVAPLRAVVEEAVELLAAGNLDRLAVVYGARSPSQLMYRSDLGRWQAAGAEVALTVDAVEEPDRWVPPGNDPHSTWGGAVGLVPDALAPTGLDWSDTTAFVCGPDVMMRFTALRLIELGVRPDRIWFTMERNMQCGNALCGHCQLGPFIVCRDGPVA
ncbi:MAG: FAD/NAD(P)-binding protein, partial [Acidimicrobiia bacterium]|nr:FAD/NAD(P)-binding protein [Acidimicrobiia bacterium]